MRMHSSILMVLWTISSITTAAPSGFDVSPEFSGIPEEVDIFKLAGVIDPTSKTLAYSPAPIASFTHGTYSFSLISRIAGTPNPFYSVTCETSEASPSIDEIDGCIAILDAKEACWQGNRWDSKCSKLVTMKGGEVSLCGSITRVDCKFVVWAISRVRNVCAWSELSKAGGYFSFDVTSKLKVRAVVH
ncbi:hypothetical protein BZA05DRAFT_442255 [Tricharina praecox]|uniref:uncharacterized protein n=1 Tax=Tricharina praecox TaxID=43433 RepID=UPI0022212905|nr:uncharacterized protein BZA05DRAFT_442255 [Tricharina praecox]KAI5856576.1 hypothetical protein BZA05DRAFT_442255 [Tricharina praecox]